MKTPKLFMAAALLVVAGASAQPKVIAHRGYWTVPGSAQNSLASFTEADRIGCYGSEIDVWMTSDNRLIVNHDRIYKGTDIHMERSTFKRITSIELPNGEKIPSLDAYLKLVADKPATRLVLEIKSLSDYNREDLCVEKILRALEKYKLTDRTDIIAFSVNVCLAVKKRMPDMPVYYLNGDLPPKSVKKLKFDGIDYAADVLREHPQWVEQAQALGLGVNVWTVNTEEEMRYFIDLGVDYITTDYPERLQALLGK